MYPWTETPPMEAWNWMASIMSFFAVSPLFFAGMSTLNGRQCLRELPDWLAIPLGLWAALGLLCMHPLALFVYWLTAASALPALGAPLWASVWMMVMAVGFWAFAVYAIVSCHFTGRQQRC